MFSGLEISTYHENGSMIPISFYSTEYNEFLKIIYLITDFLYIIQFLRKCLILWMYKLKSFYMNRSYNISILTYPLNL